MNAAIGGNEVHIGENPDDFFEKANRAYVEKIEELKRKLGGVGK